MRALLFFVLILGAGFWMLNPDVPVAVTRPDRLPRATAKAKPPLAAPAPRRPAATTAPGPRNPVASDLEKIRALNGCYESRRCGYPETDPRSYEFAAGQALKKALADFRKTHSSAQRELQDLAREFIRSGDGHVQAEALAIFQDLPPSAENLQALTTGLKNTPDAALLTKALPELRRYLGTDWEPQVHDFLGTTIATGAHFSSETASQNILQFLTPQSYGVYQKTLTTMTPGARSTRNLDSALREYRRLRNGA